MKLFGCEIGGRCRFGGSPGGNVGRLPTAGMPGKFGGKLPTGGKGGRFPTGGRPGNGILGILGMLGNAGRPTGGRPGNAGNCRPPIIIGGLPAILLALNAAAIREKKKEILD